MQRVELLRVQNVVKIGGTVAEIRRIFRMAAAAILDFLIFEILAVGTLKRAKLRHRIKLRLNSGPNMAIFRFFKMAATPILDF